MKEGITLANEELKRVDHLIYVSLKYTRTVDVIRSILTRMITAIEHMIDANLAHALEVKKIKVIPEFPIEKCKLLKEHFSGDIVVQEMVDFYLSLRKLVRAEFVGSQEFRRHVTMAVLIKDEKPIEINIDKIHEFYEKIKTFYDHTVLVYEDSSGKKKEFK